MRAWAGREGNIKMEKSADKRIYLAIIIAAYAAFFVFDGLMAIPKTAIDFPTFYFPAKLAFEKGISPYDYEALQKAGSGEKTFVYPYPYPPAGLMFFYPLSLLPYNIAKLVMFFINQAMILLFLYIFLFKVMKAGKEWAFLVFSAVYVFLFYSCKANIELGQVNLILVVLICLGWSFLIENKHPALTAAPFAAALLLKLFPLIFLFYFIFARKFRVLLWSIFYVFAAYLLSIIVLPSAAWPAWAKQVAPTLGYSKTILDFLSPTVPWNVNVNSFMSRLFMESEYSKPVFASKILAAATPYLINFALVAVSCFALFINAKNTRAASMDGVCAFLLLLHMTSSYSGEMHLVYIIPALLVLMYRAIESGENYFFSLSLAAAVCIAMPFPFSSAKNWFLSLLLSFKFFILLAIWVYFIRSLWKQAGNMVKKRVRAPVQVSSI